MRVRQLLLAIGTFVVFPTLLAIGVFVFISDGGRRDNAFSTEDFKKVQEGMTEAELKELLGKPFETLQSVGDWRRHSFKSGESYFTVSVEKGKVLEPDGPMNKKDYDESQFLCRAMIEMVRNVK